MTVISIDIRPLSDGPYPVVPNVHPYVEHAYYQCGEPDFCLHEAAPPEEDVFYQSTLIPNATEPKIFGNTEDLKVNPLLPGWLMQLGLSEKKATGVAIMFYSPGGADRLASFAGYYDGYGKTDLSTPEGVYYPLAIHIRSGSKHTNHTIWHELSHALIHANGLRQSGADNLYNDSQKVSLTRKIGTVTTMGSFAAIPVAAAIQNATEAILPATAVAGVLSLIGLVSYTRPEAVLSLFDSEERQCNRFARRHKELPVILPLNT